MTQRKAWLNDGVRAREVWAWACYDFANSGYTTVVITAIFNAYFVGVIAGKAPWATFAWTAALSVSYVLIVLTAPLVGAWADAHAAKKRVLFVATAGCVIGTAALSLAGPGQLWVAVVALVISNTFYGTGENITAAFLPELARGDALGKISGWAWAFGYVGGLVSLGACLGYVTWAQGRGQEAEDFVPVTMVITAILFAVASLPTFLIMKERARPQRTRAGAYAGAFSRLGATLRHAGQFRDLARFLVCILFYQAGVQTVVSIAAIYAQEAMGFGTRETLIMVLLVNITASIGAFGFGYVQDRVGHVRSVGLTLIGWCVTTLVAWRATEAAWFWLAANLAGLCMGASQSAGRALVGYFSPETRRAEFFGLWGLSVKLSSILGPLTYGVVSWVSRGDHRLAMLLTGVFFVIGLALLAGVKADRGRQAALDADHDGVFREGA
ncbi:MAG: MFS transporter [Betaproteobacteria bacterium]|nr:MFS transporter [Betaproteobacteria bacterium]